MADSVKLNNGGAIDARFMAIDKAFESVNKELGKQEGRLDKLEESNNHHSNGFIKHETVIEHLTKSIDGMAKTVAETSEKMSNSIDAIKNRISYFLGAIAVIGVAISFYLKMI